MQKVIVILGQTAAGKSDLAVKIAKKINGEIISADSRQVYKNLNIGSGKITKKEMEGVPHHLLDVANPKIKFTVVKYQKLAISAMADIVKRGKTPIICGGTGFYIDAVNKVRLIRAVEIAKALGKVPKETEARLPFNFIKIGLYLPTAKLKNKIEKRLLTRIKMGMLNEAKKLHKQGLSWKRMEELGLEYRFMALYLQNKINKK